MPRIRLTAADEEKVGNLILASLKAEDLHTMTEGEKFLTALRVACEMPERSGIFLNEKKSFYAAMFRLTRTGEFKAEPRHTAASRQARRNEARSYIAQWDGDEHNADVLKERWLNGGGTGLRNKLQRAAEYFEEACGEGHGSMLGLLRAALSRPPEIPKSFIR